MGGEVSMLRKKSIHPTFGGFLAIDPHALGKGEEVWGGMIAHTITGPLEDGGEEGRSRAFAVGASNVDDRISPVGMVQASIPLLHKREGRVEAFAAAEFVGSEPLVEPRLPGLQAGAHQPKDKHTPRPHAGSG